MTDTRTSKNCDVAIIGGGPAGLSAATALKHSGVGHVVVLEREPRAGGIPRHCGHPPFGINEFTRILTGPDYARRLVECAVDAGVDIALKTTVTALGPSGVLDIVSPAGRGKVRAKRVLLAMGVRETPRAARLVSGDRALGICTTGALQSMVYLNNSVPFRKPVIVGAELVSYSALLTCRKADIRPAAMLDERPRSHVWWPIELGALPFRVPFHYGARISAIIGKNRVERVRVARLDGKEIEIACDGILFTGRFVPEASLVRLSHLTLNPETGGPLIDRFSRCSDPAYFAAGNILRGVETAGTCWREGRAAARRIAHDLNVNRGIT